MWQLVSRFEDAMLRLYMHTDTIQLTARCPRGEAKRYAYSLWGLVVPRASSWAQTCDKHIKVTVMSDLEDGRLSRA